MKPAAPLHLAPLLLAFVAGGALGAGCRSGEAPPPVYVDAPPPPGAGVRGKPVVVEAESTFAAPHSGRLAEAVRVTYYRLEGEDYSGHGYGFSDDTGQPHLGPLVLPAFEFEVRLADLNFDGWADLWVSGRRDQRVHASDVWLYVPSDSVLMERGDIRRHRAWSGYVYSTALSDLPNLAVDTTQHRLL
ncbi:MAG TPA: hypothetical protein VK610_03220, partial [Rhodothermales bacterium]|nr:hypothetical protein [Rhodothermales bacterium]